MKKTASVLLFLLIFGIAWATTYSTATLRQQSYPIGTTFLPVETQQIVALATAAPIPGSGETIPAQIWLANFSQPINSRWVTVSALNTTSSGVTVTALTFSLAASARWKIGIAIQGTSTPTRTPTRTKTPTVTNTASHTNTETDVPTDTPSHTPSRTPTCTHTPTVTSTPTVTLTPVDTAVVGLQETATAIQADVDSAEATATAIQKNVLDIQATQTAEVARVNAVVATQTAEVVRLNSALATATAIQADIVSVKATATADQAALSAVVATATAIQADMDTAEGAINAVETLGTDQGTTIGNLLATATAIQADLNTAEGAINAVETVETNNGVAIVALQSTATQVEDEIINIKATATAVQAAIAAITPDSRINAHATWSADVCATLDMTPPAGMWVMPMPKNMGKPGPMEPIGIIGIVFFVCAFIVLRLSLKPRERKTVFASLLIGGMLLIFASGVLASTAKSQTEKPAVTERISK